MTRLKHLMIKHGLTVRDGAFLAGCTARMVEHWRSGKYPAPRPFLLVLEALDENRIDIAWLLSKLERLKND